MGRVADFLEGDHARLDGLLARATAGEQIELEAFELFREGLLRHIAMEEKILLTDARRRRAGEPLQIAKRLRVDHGVLAALLVPTPTLELLETLREVLVEHHPLEEGPGGVYELCERLAGDEVDALLARIKEVPRVPVAAHFDGPRARESIENHLRARAELLEK